MSEAISITLFFLYVLSLLVCCIAGWINRKNRSLNPIRIYLSLSLLTTVIQILIPNTETGKVLFHIMVNLFSMADVLIIYYYFSRLLRDPRLKKALGFLLAVICGLAVFFYTSRNFGITSFLTSLLGLENLFITIPCFFYFYELFTSDEATDMRTNPHFYVASGILFFYGITFPFYIGYKKLYDITPEIFGILLNIHHTVYVIYYIIILKAFLCRQPGEKSFS